MHIIYLFFIAMLNSIDNLGIGAAYSIAGKKVSIRKNILIASMAFAVCFISSLSGGILSHYLNEQICSMLSMLLFVFMGLVMIYQGIAKKDNDNLEKYNIISNKETVTVGALLALDDIGSAVSLGLMGYGPFIASISYSAMSLIIFFLANYGTRFVAKLNIGRKAVIISGVLMVLMGLLQLV